MKLWRIGQVLGGAVNVYDGDGKPVCLCQTQEQAALIVEAVNFMNRMTARATPPADDPEGGAA